MLKWKCKSILRIANRSIFQMIVFVSSLLLVISLSLSTFIGFIVTRDKVKKDFTASANQLLIQNKNYVDFLSEVVESTSMQILSDRAMINELAIINDGSYEMLQKIMARQSKISNITSQGENSIIDSVVIYNDHGNSVTSQTGSSISDEELKTVQNTYWYKKVKTLGGKSMWIPPHTNNMLSSNNEVEYISNVRVLTNDRGEEAGVLEINMKLDRLQEKVAAITMGKSGYMRVVDKNGFVISSKEGVKTGEREQSELMQRINDNIGKFFNAKINGTKMLIMCEVSESTGWRFLALIPEKELYMTASSIGLTNAIIAIIFLVVSIAITTALSKTISKPLQNMVTGTKALAEGNFAVELKESSIIEVNELANNFNKMVLELKGILQATKDLSDESTEAAVKLQEITQSVKVSSDAATCTINVIAGGSYKQTEEISCCVDFTKQLNVEIGTTINNINSIQNTTDTTLEILEEKSEIISQLKESSTDNKETIAMVAITINKLGDSVKDILAILNNINDITDRTNLLALNAAIEAARAGEAGKGFAIVANEVKKLAEQSKKSSESIKRIIGNVQSSIGEAVRIADKATVNFEGEYRMVDNTIEAFNIIRNSFGSILSRVEKSTGSISKLEKDKDILIRSIDNISSVSQDNSAATEELSATMEEQATSNSEVFNLTTNLTEKSKQLNLLITKFKL